jgi:hypothetical protein
MAIDSDHTDCNPNVINGVILPQGLLRCVEGQLGEDKRRNKSLEARLEQSPSGLRLDAVPCQFGVRCKVTARELTIR